jgi:hypothetical protein
MHHAAAISSHCRIIPSSLRFLTSEPFLAAFPEVDFGTGLYLMQMMTQQT